MRRAGKIRHLGLTNFDTPHLSEIVASGAEISSVQVQYSVLDQRPASGLAALCAEHGVWLLCYGSVAGGFLSDRWLGALEPSAPLENRSLVKYKLIIDDFGGWDLFQELLRTLRRVADRHGADLRDNRQPLGSRPASRRRRDRRSPQSLACRRQCADNFVRAFRNG